MKAVILIALLIFTGSAQATCDTELSEVLIAGGACHIWRDQSNYARANPEAAAAIGGFWNHYAATLGVTVNEMEKNCHRLFLEIEAIHLEKQLESQ